MMTVTQSTMTTTTIARIMMGDVLQRQYSDEKSDQGGLTTPGVTSQNATFTLPMSSKHTDTLLA